MPMPAAISSSEAPRPRAAATTPSVRVKPNNSRSRATAIATTLAAALDHVGVLAVECFRCGDDLIVNELAPRVHNSGHWSIEGAVTSQFENHIRAVAGLPLGDTSPRGVSCMLNWIGELPDRNQALSVPGLHWHDYGKSPRTGRKVGDYANWTTHPNNPSVRAAE